LKPIVKFDRTSVSEELGVSGSGLGDVRAVCRGWVGITITMAVQTVKAKLGRLGVVDVACKNHD
jgi:hypothetical protein